jgi:hypothetical protein
MLSCIWATSNKSERLMHLVGWFISMYMIQGHANPKFCALFYLDIFLTKHETPQMNPLNTKLSPICHLLLVLDHPILHVSRIRVNATHCKTLLLYPNLCSFFRQFQIINITVVYDLTPCFLVEIILLRNILAPSSLCRFLVLKHRLQNVLWQPGKAARAWQPPTRIYFRG